MTIDYRALCAELAGWIERSTRYYIQEPDVLIRARYADMCLEEYLLFEERQGLAEGG